MGSQRWKLHINYSNAPGENAETPEADRNSKTQVQGETLLLIIFTSFDTKKHVTGKQKWYFSNKL